MKKYTMHNAQQGHQLLMDLWQKLKPHLLAGRKLELTVTEQKRSLDQNAMFHSILSQIARQAEHAGAKWSVDDWKRLTLDLWNRERGAAFANVVPALDKNGIVQLGLSSRSLTKPEASEYTEFLMAWAAQNGIEIREI